MTAATLADVLAARRAAGRVLRLYHKRDMQPTHWIGEGEDGVLYEWPAEDAGSQVRMRYTGDRSSLTEVELHNAVGTGWPGLEMPA